MTTLETGTCSAVIVKILFSFSYTYSYWRRNDQHRVSSDKIEVETLVLNSADQIETGC